MLESARMVGRAAVDVLALFRGLLADPAVPWRAKAALVIGAAYLASPLDLIPDFIPVVGQLDDAIVAIVVLGYVTRVAGREAVLRNWRGEPALIRRLLRMQGVSTQRVLFLCIGNSCRSQIAEGLLRAYGGDRFEAHSAGVLEGRLRPETVDVMREIGIDISTQYSKKAELYAGQEFDVVVTTCDEAKEACPLFPGAKRTIHWSIPDPVGQDMDAFRAARDELKGLIARELLAS